MNLFIFKALFIRGMSIILFFVNYLSFSQLTVNNFFDALIHNPENISAFVDSTELSLANRLGINYNEIKNKFLIWLTQVSRISLAHNYEKKSAGNCRSS